VAKTTRDDNGSFSSRLIRAIHHVAAPQREKSLKNGHRSAEAPRAASSRPFRAEPPRKSTPPHPHLVDESTEVLMDPLKRCGAIAAAVLTLALTACGGGSSADTTSTGSSNNGGSTAQTVQGVSTPSSVSVVTAKNAQ